jgi:hypothetical protein
MDFCVSLRFLKPSHLLVFECAAKHVVRAQAAYKGFAPGITSLDGVDIASIQSIQEQPVTSAIVHPQFGETVEPNQPLEVSGFAWYVHMAACPHVHMHSIVIFALFCIVGCHFEGQASYSFSMMWLAAVRCFFAL